MSSQYAICSMYMYCTLPLTFKFKERKIIYYITLQNNATLFMMQPINLYIIQ